MIHSFLVKASKMVAFLLVLIMVIAFSFPQPTHAGFFSSISQWLTGTAASADDSEVSVGTSSVENAGSTDSKDAPVVTQSVQTVETATNPDPKPIKVESEAAVVADSAVLAENGPAGSITEAEEDNYGQISVYTVHKGDSIGSIAKMFDVSSNTILWANGITAKELKEGMNLVILPVSGVKYVAKKGDTIKSIASKFKGDVGDIIAFNGLKANQTLVAGDEIIIPDGEAPVVAISYSSYSGNSVVPPGAAKNPTERLRGTNVPEFPGYYTRPVTCVKTQGLHGWNAIDFGCSVGSPARAAAGGTVIISRMGGWNGGYGNYVVISHPNGTQTLYGHLSKTLVTVGESVTQGELIGLTGNTGKSTGPHIHFEIRGGRNPWATLK
jgi:LysM repeat protein